MELELWQRTIIIRKTVIRERLTAGNVFNRFIPFFHCYCSHYVLFTKMNRRKNLNVKKRNEELK